MAFSVVMESRRNENGVEENKIKEVKTMRESSIKDDRKGSIKAGRVQPTFFKVGSRRYTYVVPPRDVVGGRVGPDVALEVDVVALLDGGWVKAGAEFQHGDGNIWKKG